MKLVKAERQGQDTFALVVEHDNGQKERWLYDRVERKTGVDFIQTGKESA